MNKGRGGNHPVYPVQSLVNYEILIHMQTLGSLSTDILGVPPGRWVCRLLTPRSPLIASPDAEESRVHHLGKQQDVGHPREAIHHAGPEVDTNRG